MEDSDRPVFSISIVAQMLELHPQTLRLYEREGLIVPGRTKGKTRLYSLKDLERLRTILHLTQEIGVNLAGVGLFLEFQEKVNEMESKMHQALERLGCGAEPGTRPREKKKAIKVKIERG